MSIGIGLGVNIGMRGLFSSLPPINITATPVIAGTSDPSGDVTVSSLGASDTIGATVDREWVRGNTVVGSYPTPYTKTGADAGQNIRLREVWSLVDFRTTTTYSNTIAVDAAAPAGIGSMAIGSTFVVG